MYSLFILGDASKAKQFLPFLQRAGRISGIVEFVASGSRLRVYIPKETCLITLLLAGIECPRMQSTGNQGHVITGEPYGEEAYNLTRDLCLQKDVRGLLFGVEINSRFHCCLEQPFPSNINL